MASNQNFNEIFKMFGDFRTPQFPQVDWNSLFATQRRNIEAFSEAGQVMTEGFQAVTRRQAETVRENVSRMIKASKDLFSGPSPEASAARQAEFAREAFETAFNNAREMSEMVTKSSYEAFDVLNKRAAEQLEEITHAVNAPASRKKAA